MYQSKNFYKTIKLLAQPVLRASSESGTVHRSAGEISYLPYVTAKNFEQEFLDFISAHNVSLLYAPHWGIWWRVKELIKTHSLNLRMCNESPFDMDCSSYRDAFGWAHSCLEPFPVHSSLMCRLPLSEALYANLHRGYSNIPGQSDDEKIRLLVHIAKNSPDGDVIEIGSLYGRSSYALAFLANSHKIGNLICIDPWRLSNISDQGEGSDLLNDAVVTVDMEEIFINFTVSMAGFDNVNYIRMPSAAAISLYEEYAKIGKISSSQFGVTDVVGEISILHIDGNHAYEEVKSDIKNWVKLVKKGGWILLDDYLWEFGDGPKRAGDELLSSSDWSCAFCVGDTLCIQM